MGLPSVDGMDLTTTAEHQKCMINAEEGGGGAGTPAGDAARPAPWWRRVTAYGGFLAGTGLVALTSPTTTSCSRPGIRAADHLVTGLVPLALLGLAAWGSPGSAPAPGRARVAVGLFGLTVAAEAVYYTRRSGRPLTTSPAGPPCRPACCWSAWAPRRCGALAGATAVAPAAGARGLRLVAAVVFGYLS